MKDCIFCKIIDGEIPSRTVFEDEQIHKPRKHHQVVRPVFFPMEAAAFFLHFHCAHFIPPALSNVRIFVKVYLITMILLYSSSYYMSIHGFD